MAHIKLCTNSDNLLTRQTTSPPPKSTRPYIAKKVKALSWYTYIGKDIATAKCLCCKINSITQMEFDCGHIIALSRGGTNSIDNIRPICAACNKSMGTQSMVDFALAHHFGPIRDKPAAQKQGLVKVDLSNIVSWNEANQLAQQHNARLPTSAELKDLGVNAGSRDMWMPAINVGGNINEWVQIGKHTVSRYSYHIPNYGPPAWGLDNSNHAFRPRPGDPINYIYIIKGFVLE